MELVKRKMFLWIMQLALNLKLVLPYINHAFPCKQIQLLRNQELALRNCSPNQLGFLFEAPLYLEIEQSLGFLYHLMLGTPASPVRKILLESGLGYVLVGCRG
ncbi:UNVERIFIED_CONTAM: Presequence protease 1, chloroplastic/mitochondrial [Sesamum indicum]